MSVIHRVNPCDEAFIDLSRPQCPSHWVIKEHKNIFDERCQPEIWEGRKVKLYGSPKQSGEGISSSLLEEELAGKPVLNGCHFDFLFANLRCIPEEWKEVGAVVFWGTRFNSPVLLPGVTIVRMLLWSGRIWLDSFWRFNQNFPDFLRIAMFREDWFRELEKAA